VRGKPFRVAVLAALTLAVPAVAEAPPTPRGNFGGGALASPPRDIFGAGNVVVALRALPARRLEIEATVRARCAGGDISADAKLAADGTFGAKGTVTQQPDPVTKVVTTYELSGRFTTDQAADGTISATIERSVEGRTTTCKTGKVAFGARRPVTGVGSIGAPAATRYYGTTTQRSAGGPNRPIVLRIAGDGRRVTRALFAYSVTCSDDTVAIGVEAPRTNIRIDSRGRVRDRDQSTQTEGETVVHIDDGFTAELGAKGARGTFTLSDRTTDRASGRTIQTCKTGTIRWRASR
jgi:hypothetical protein